MAEVEGCMSLAARQYLRASLLENPDPFILAMPKVELHIHIEGILSPELKWKFAQRNNLELRHPRTGKVFETLEEYRDSHEEKRDGKQNNAEETLSFFEAYYSGFEVLKTKQDYYDLAMEYYEHAAKMNVRYAEIFFDPQGHTKCGVSWDTMMSGFRDAQSYAEQHLNVHSAWIMCFLRDMSPESAMEHYIAALPYRDMIVGIGLDSTEDGRPPNLFQEVFAQARKDGFRITAHCDVGETYPLEHIRQCFHDIKTDRIDHGLNIVSSPSLLSQLKEKDDNFGLTICPWSYIRHQPFDEVFHGIRVLIDAGIRIAIGSDDPAFMEDTWVLENLLLVKRECGLSNAEMKSLGRGAVEMCWAPEEVKREILRELEGLEM